MAEQSAQDLIDELDALLDRERQALIKGDLEGLGRLLDRKQNLIENINGMDVPEQERLALVHEKVTRNQSLMTSAMEGIRAVANRMADLRRLRQGLETYDQSGRKSRIEAQGRSTVEKRA